MVINVYFRTSHKNIVLLRTMYYENYKYYVFKVYVLYV